MTLRRFAALHGLSDYHVRQTTNTEWELTKEGLPTQTIVINPRPTCAEDFYLLFALEV